MKKTVNLILAMLFATSAAFATTTEGTWESFTWSYDKSTNTLTISGEGALPDLSENVYGPWVSSSIVPKTIVIEEGITAIGAWDFAGYSALKTITLPSTVETIGDYAFYKCVGLNNIEFTTGLKTIGSHAFAYCTSLGSGDELSLPDGLEVIGEYAFANSTVTGLVIPASVTDIEAYAFYETGITSVIFEDGSKCKEIGEGAFKSCYIEEIDFGENSALKVIGEYAFYGNIRLTEIIIPNNIEEIGDYAYWGCTNVSNITIYASNPPTIYEHTFPFTETYWWGYAWAKYVISFVVYSEDYLTAEYWADFKDHYTQVITKEASAEITALVESVTITYGDAEVDVDALVETEYEYTVTYAQVDEDGNIIDGTETEEQPTEAGDYVIIYTILETDTTIGAEVEVSLTIDKKDTDALSNIDPDGYTTESGTVIDFEELVSPEDPDAEVTVKYYDEEGNEYDEQPTEPGEYTVVITVEDTDNINGGEVETTLTITATGDTVSTGIDDVDVTTSVKVVAGDIVIETSEAMQARVYSINGALVAETTVDGKATISTTKGIYVVVLSNGRATKVLVK